MIASPPLRILVSGLILASALVGTAAGISLGTDWKQTPILADNTFSGVTLTPDAGRVYSGGSQLVYRSWDNTVHWGGQPGFIAAMSIDGGYVVTSSGSTITLLNASGTQLWSRTMDGQIRAVAVSPNATYVISADDKGNYNAWAGNGDFYGRNKSDLVRRIAISPDGTLIVVTTERGIRYYATDLSPLWTDNRSGSLDDYILFSADSSTVITAGGSRVSSHTKSGVLNWQANVATADINDIACSQDCSLIVVGSQDNAARGIDRYGKTHWTFPTGQWANAVGVSGNGGTIAVGSNDGTIFIVDHGGKELTRQKLTGRIQPRSMAVSSDGTKIVAADQYNLYGLILGGTGGEGTVSDTTFVAATLNPVPKNTARQTAVTTTPTEMTTPVEEGPPTLPAPTKKSPAGAWAVIPAVAGAILIARTCRR